MSSSFNWAANTESLDEQHEPIINIPFMQLKRANKTAIDYLGQKWSPAHDKFAVRWLFRRGIISDFEKELLLEKVAEKMSRIKKMSPHQGRWRVW
jgi:hypothetical protein